MKVLAFLLPQFHPVPENDAWWGAGFTEWRNVVKAKPLFAGHYQPHLPSDLGYYDLRVPETREAQADLAREYGVDGFCYYHYWFNGRRILERPFNEVLASGKPDFPFCLCWANENWTRIWDGGSAAVLLEQKYSDIDDMAHIESLLPAFRDPRYIRVGGKPLFLVYRTGSLPDPARTTRIWRAAARAAGLEGLYLVRVESHGDATDPTSIGFDASLDFAPFTGWAAPHLNRGPVTTLLRKIGLSPQAFGLHEVRDYRDVVAASVARPEPAFKRFSGVSPGWDNTARKKKGGMVLVESTPQAYEAWLASAAERTRKRFEGDESLLFVNAWNEWAEGNHLEPDLRWGRAYLEATKRVVRGGA